MRKLATTATTTAKESEKITGQIQDVENQQTTLASELDALDHRLDLLAGQEEVEERAVAEALSRKQAILAEVDFLTRRVQALEKKRAEAERREAEGRVAEIETETTKPVTGQPSSLETLRKHRIIRVRRQNERLALDLKRAKGELVSLDSIKREVLAANSTVKSQLLALSHRLAAQLASTSERSECARIMEAAIVQACNDLAFERERPPETCPTCGRGMKEEEK